MARFAVARFAVARFAVARFAVARFAVARFAVARFAVGLWVHHRAVMRYTRGVDRPRCQIPAIGWSRSLIAIGGQP